MKKKRWESGEVSIRAEDGMAVVTLKGTAPDILYGLITLNNAVCIKLGIEPEDLARVIAKDMKRIAFRPDYAVDLNELRRQAGRE